MDHETELRLRAYGLWPLECFNLTEDDVAEAEGNCLACQGGPYDEHTCMDELRGWGT